jgi:hypothetical protein
MKIISGKNEIVYLLSKVIEKFEKDNDKTISRNSNRKNYEPIAEILSEISNRLPYTHLELKHDIYAEDKNPLNQGYPYRKYDISANQIKDSYFNQIVSNPRPFLVDACYIYLYGKGRKGFLEEPTDKNLISNNEDVEKDRTYLDQSFFKTIRKKIFRVKILLKLTIGLSISFLLLSILYIKEKYEKDTLISDLKIRPYQPSREEIEKLEGVWLCYTGSPQARISDKNRYHLIVPNILNVKFKNGYFVFTRYGASFDHEGYMQYESSGIVSIHSYVKTVDGAIESPRHSLLKFENKNKYLNVISASWNFDVAEKNKIIGIREVYMKQGKGGKISEIINTLENASCRCKIVKWENDNNNVKTFYLKNELLDNLKDEELKMLLNEKSILLRDPNENLIIRDTLTD